MLNISTLLVNDSHNYYGGAIGNIAYNQLSALASLDGLTVDTTVAGTDFEEEQPASLSVEIVDDYAGVETYLKRALSSADIITHLYFHEPEWNPVSKSVADSGTPFVIGMCEVPHPRFSDEVSGIERLPLVRSIGRRLLKPRFKRTLRRADKLVVVDEHARDYYSQYFPREQIEVVPYGVRLDRFEPSPLPDTPRVLMVNRLIERRGVDHMIEAFPQVRRAVPDAELHLVGDGPRRKKLSELADELGVRAAVTFHGNVGPEALVDHYADATVFSHLSVADGWNQPALEAMASGRPVVCTDRPHNSMVSAGESGYKIPWESPDAVADRLVELLSDRERAAAFGSDGRDLAEERYAWPDIAARYREILEGVVAD